MPDKVLALDPALGEIPEEVIADWNTNPDFRKFGQARLLPDSARGYLDPLLTGALIGFAVSVTGGVTSNLILDFIRARLRHNHRPTEVESTARLLPDGTELIIVRMRQV